MTPIPRPAASAIVVDRGRVLLIRRARPPAADLYAFPGGKGEEGESPAETALRELREETGLIADTPELFATYDLRPEPGAPAHQHYLLSVFRVRLTSPATAARALSDAADLGWYTGDEVRALPVPASVLECVERLGLGDAASPMTRVRTGEPS